MIFKEWLIQYIYHITFIPLSIVVFFLIATCIDFINCDKMFYFSPRGGEMALDSHFLLFQFYYSLLIFGIYGIFKPVNYKSVLIVILLSFCLTVFLKYHYLEFYDTDFLKHFFSISIFWVEMTIILSYLSSYYIVNLIRKKRKNK